MLRPATHRLILVQSFARYTLLIVAAVFAFAPICRSAEPNEALTKQILQVLAECEKIKPGMSRADLLKVFEGAGGLSTAAQRTFDYRAQPYIHVDVEFKLADPKDVLKENPDDQITKISRPYLAYGVQD